MLSPLAANITNRSIAYNSSDLHKINTQAGENIITFLTLAHYYHIITFPTLAHSSHYHIPHISTFLTLAHWQIITTLTHRIFQVPHYIPDILDADRDADHAVGDAVLFADLLRHIEV